MKTNKRKLGKGLLAVAGLSAFLLGRQLKAQEQEVQKPVQKPLVELVVDYETGKKATESKYEQSYAYFSTSSNYLYANSNLGFTFSEKQEVEDLITDAKLGTIDSYNSFVKGSDDFSQNQKLALLAAMANMAYRGYDYTLANGEVLNQEDFFQKLQNLLNGEEEIVGICRHISSNIEQLANDIGLRAAAITGTKSGYGHVYDLIKLNEGTAIVDGRDITITDTKNIERVLEMYQLEADSPKFQHLFFEDSRFKYELITKDGRNFLVFLVYDKTTDKLKDSLTEKQKPRMPITLSFKTNDQMFYAGINFLGFFGKMGELYGDVNSPIKKLQLAQLGYDYGFSFPGVLDLDISLSGIFGTSTQKDNSKSSPIGAAGNLMINTSREKGLNASLRIKGNILNASESTCLYDLGLETGASWRIPVQKVKITPYALAEFSILPPDIGPLIYLPVFTEAKAGAVFQIPISTSGDKSVVIEPSYAYRPSGHEVDLSLKLKGKDMELYANGTLTKSTYDFAPDKAKIDSGFSTSVGPIRLKAGFKEEWKNYDGEIDDNYSFYLNGSLNMFFKK